MVNADDDFRFSGIDHYWKSLSSICNEEREVKYQNCVHWSIVFLLFPMGIQVTRGGFLS